MYFETIYKLATKMKISKEQFDSFKFFIFTKYENQIYALDNHSKVSEILNLVYEKLPHSIISKKDRKAIIVKSNKKPKKNNDKFNDYKKDRRPRIKSGVNQPKSIIINVSENEDRKRKTKNSRVKDFVSKNKISLSESNVLKLKTDFIRQPHTLFGFCEKLQWDVNKFILVISKLGFNDLKPSSMLKLEHIEPFVEAILDRRRVVIKWESEIVTKNVSKTKPNYFKLMINPIGTKR